jgi:hypothetical protein
MRELWRRAATVELLRWDASGDVGFAFERALCASDLSTQTRPAIRVTEEATASPWQALDALHRGQRLRVA